MSLNKLHQLVDSHHKGSRALTLVGGASLSYGNLILKSKKIAAGLQADGFAKGDRMLILAELDIDTLACIIALLRIGGVPVVADPGSGRDVLQARIDESAAKWILISSKLYLIRNHPLLQRLIRSRRKDLPHLFRVKLPKNIVLTPSRALKSRPTIRNYLRSDETNFEEKNHDEALIVFTSGTTESPKGVIHTHESLLAGVQIVGELINHSEPILYTHQPYFALLGIVIGAHVILDNRAFNTQRFIANANIYKPTLTFGPPGEFIPVINYISGGAVGFPPSYKQIMFGSAPITQSFLRKFKAICGAVKATCLYGMTEAIPISSVDMDKKIAFQGDGDLLGSPAGDIQMRVVDDELLVKGPQVAPSYLNKKPQSWISTGDLVTLKEKIIILKGRKKDMILRRSYNIYPSLYESTITGIKGIQACALIGVYDAAAEDERIILVVEPDGSVKLTSSDIDRQLKQGKHSIDSNALPDEIVIAQLPRTGRQLKIDKAALRGSLR